MGALPEQTAEFGFGGGLSEKEDSWLSSSGLGTLHNCVQDKSGALEKHPGYAQYTSVIRNGDANVPVNGLLMDSALAALNSPKLVKRADQVGIIANGFLFAKADKQNLQGRVSPWVCEQRTVCQADGARFDCCCSGAWIYTAHELASGGVRVVVTYAPTNETVTLFAGANIPATGLSEPRIVAIDAAGTALLFYLNGAQGKYHVVTPDGVGAAHNITLVAGYDVVSDPASSQVWFVFLPSLTTLQSDNYTYAAGSLSIHSTYSVPGGVTHAVRCTICVDVASGKVTLWWVDFVAAGGSNFTMEVLGEALTLNYSSTLWAAVVWQEPTPAPLLGHPLITTIGAAFSPFDGFFVAFTDTERNRVVGKWVNATTGATIGNGGPGGAGDIIAPCVYLRSRPVWDVATQRMVCLADAGAATGATSGRRAHLVLGIEPRTAAGKAAAIAGTGPASRFGVLGAFSYSTAGAINNAAGNDLLRIARPFQDASSVWHLQSMEIGGQGASLQLICDYALLADDRVGGFAELGKATYINGAVLSQWDGVRVCEAAFLLDPMPVQNVGVTTGGAIAVGSYVYSVTYMRMTATGELVRSRPAPTGNAVTISSSGATISMVCAPPGPSNLTEQDNLRVIAVEFWRSEKNTTSPLYFAGRVFVDLASGAAVTFADSTATYAGAEQLYSDGTNGEIANTPTASPLSVCQWRNRLWMTDGEQIYYTKEAAATRAAEWSQAFFTIPRGAPARLTAVAPLGETLMVFSEDSSSYVYGDGPGANGDGSTLVGPMPAITELGCVQAGGIAQLPDGLLIPTRRGLQLLDGKRAFSYIGAAIESTLAAFPRVRCARHIGGTDRVWICLATQDLTDSVAVILDTHHKTFGTVFSQAEMFGRNMVHCSSIDVNGAHSFSVTDGNVYDQTPGTFLVGNSIYRQVVETPWFKASGPSGELRARRFALLMKQLGVASGLAIEIGYDFHDAYTYSGGPDPLNLPDMEGQPDTFQLRIAFPRQRCQSYRMRFTEGASTGSAGFRFVSLRMTTSLRPGSGKLLSKTNSPAAFTKS